jgi:hypothetical protein
MTDDSDNKEDVVEFPNGYKVDKSKFLSKRDLVLLKYKDDHKAPSSYTDALAIAAVFGDEPKVDLSGTTDADGEPLSASESDSEPEPGTDHSEHLAAPQTGP